MRADYHGSICVVNADVGVLVVGDSGAGKTTTSLALVRSGWSYLSDDAIALRELPGTDTVAAMAFRKGFSCTQIGWEALATNTPVARNGYRLADDKWLIEMSDYAPNQTESGCVPSLVVFPIVSDQRRSTIEPIGDAQGLLKLIPQSSGITVQRDTARAHMKMLGRLADQVQFCELRAGRDIFEDPLSVSDMLLNQARSVR